MLNTAKIREDQDKDIRIKLYVFYYFDVLMLKIKFKIKKNIILKYFRYPKHLLSNNITKNNT